MSTEPDRSIETLIRLAGEREMPSEEATARARDAAEQSWRRLLATRPPRAHSRVPLALAAALGLVVLGVYAWTQREPAPPAVIVARVVMLDGGAQILRGRAAQLARPGTEVASGAVL